MFSVIFFMITGITLGYVFRNIPFLKKTEKTVSTTILFLLFFFGLNIGSNRILIQNFSTFGIQALILAVAGLTGSLIASWITYLVFFKKDKENEK